MRCVRLPVPAAVRDLSPRGMQQSHMRSPFAQDNLSSSSLEGMERPIRSFKSFIKSVPRHPHSPGKPLPPTPSARPSLSKTTSSPSASTPPPDSSGGEFSSAASWIAQEDRYRNRQATTDLKTRTYSPLLPEPPLDLSKMTSEPISYKGEASRDVPTYERPQSCSEHLGPPPRSPPRSPLPAPPAWTLNGKTRENPLTPSSALSRFTSKDAQKAVYEAELRYRTVWPANSTHTSVNSDASTKEKAFASLGIESHRQPVTIMEDGPYDSESVPQERARADQSYLRGKKLRALNKGSPLTDDSWEDADMDDKTRMLSFSQDYHDLLVDQYQEMNVRAEEVLIGGPHYYDFEFNASAPRPRLSLKDNSDEHIPRPLSWSKNSNTSSPLGSPIDSSFPRSRSVTHVPPTTSKGKHKRMLSLLPHRISAGQIRRRSSAEPTEQRDSHSIPLPRRKQIPEGEVDELLKDDQKFSMHFASRKSSIFRKKSKDHGTFKAAPTKTPPLVVSPEETATPSFRLLGGMAVVRHSEKTDTANVTEPSPTSPGSFYLDSDYPPRLDDRLSFNGRQSNTLPVAPGIAIRNISRTSDGSYYSNNSKVSSGSASGGPSQAPHPLASQIPISQYPRTPPPPPPPVSISLPRSPDKWHRLKNFAGSESHSYKPGFVAKAKEARQRHHKEARQEKLKRSIKFLGPTDPGVVSGYVRQEVVKRERRTDSDDEGEGRADSDTEGMINRRRPEYLFERSA